MSQHHKHIPLSKAELIARLRSGSQPDTGTPATASQAGAVADASVPPPQPRVRRNGWTVEKQALFLKILGQTGSVEESATRVGMATSSAYRLRQHPSAGAFRAAWSRALMFCVVTARDQAFERAISGQEVAVMRNGEVKGHRRVYSEKMIMFLLRNYDYRVNDYAEPNIEDRFIKQLDSLVDLPLIEDETVTFDD